MSSTYEKRNALRAFLYRRRRIGHDEFSGWGYAKRKAKEARRSTQQGGRQQAARQKETLENSANEKSARKLKSTKTPSHFPPPLRLSALRCRDKPVRRGKTFFNCFAAAAASDSGSAACARIARELCSVSQKASRHEHDDGGDGDAGRQSQRTRFLFAFGSASASATLSLRLRSSGASCRVHFALVVRSFCCRMRRTCFPCAAMTTTAAMLRC